MVVVMPSFAQGQEAEYEVVSALIATGIGLASPQVTDGIDAPRDVMDEEDSHQSPPDQPQQGAHPSAGFRPANGGWYQKPQGHPKRKQPADPPGDIVFHQIRNVAGQCGGVLLKEPSHMGVP